VIHNHHVSIITLPDLTVPLLHQQMILKIEMHSAQQQQVQVTGSLKKYLNFLILA
jgi:hypothetical protein